MFDDLLIEFRNDHIYIRHPENFPITRGMMEQFWPFLARECERFACTSVLIEATSPVRDMDTVGAFTSGVEASAVAPHFWLALCFHGYEPDELSELFRQAARNRGASVQFFSNPDKALTWLRANNPRFD